MSARGEVESAPGGQTEVVISVADQKLVLLRDGMRLAQYKVSTSKFGAGDSYGSYKTPLGKLRVCDKVGEALPCGSVIKHRSATGEVLSVNAPGRDPIVTRIIWLDGTEEQNKNARARGIYIHGTVEEAKIGSPVSYGCIRMRSREVMELFDQVPVGTMVTIQPDKLPRYQRWTPPAPVIIATTKAPPAEKTADKPATEHAGAKLSGPVLASQPPPSEAKPKTTMAEAQPPSEKKWKPTPILESQQWLTQTKQRSVAASEPDDESPRVSLESDRKKTLVPGDAGAAEALRGSILFADLPRHAVPTRTSVKSTPAPALEPVAEGPHREPVATEVSLPRVSFSAGHGASATQRLP